MTPQPIGTDIQTWINQARAVAHHEPNWLDVRAGDTVTTKGLGSLLRHRETVPGWETAVWLEYTVDRVPLKEGGGGERIVRHLSVKITVPGTVTQGEINAGLAQEFAETFLQSLTRVVFPLHEHVNLSARALEPRPVLVGQQMVTKTDVVFHLYVDLYASPTTAPTTARKRVTLYGPDDRPIE